MEVKDLNIIPSGDMPVIHASQFDINRTIKFNLKEDGEDYTLESGITITCAIKKVDGNLVTFEVTNTEDKYIELTLPEQATACAGLNIGEVIFSDEDDYEIGSINFILDVERSPKLGGIESESSIHDLTEQIEEITIDVITSDPDLIAELKAEIDVPTKTSQLQNDSGYITSDDIPSIPSELNDLSDVDINNISNGQILKYNSETEKFENANESGGGGGSYSKTVLWENIDPYSAITQGATINLTDSLLNYDEIYFEGAYYDSSNSVDKRLTHLITSSLLKETITFAISNYGTKQYEGLIDVAMNHIYASGYYSAIYSLKIPTNNSLYVAFKYIQGWSSGNCSLIRIIGIKY